MFASHLRANQVCIDLKLSKSYAHDMKNILVKMCVSPMFSDLDSTRKILMTKRLGTDHKTFATVQRPFNITWNKLWQSIIKIHVFIPYLQAKHQLTLTMEVFQSITPIPLPDPSNLISLHWCAFLWRTSPSFLLLSYSSLAL